MSDTRIAIITGGKQGLGLAMAKGLAQDHHCILVDRDPEVVQVAKSLKSPLGECEGLVADLADAEAARNVIAQIDEKFGHVDILVNNAGVISKNADGSIPSFGDITLEQWNNTLSINLTAMLLLCQAAVPVMARSKWGRIINISSRTARTYTRTAGIDYAVSKAGVIALSRCVAAEAGEHGITVNTIAPGPVASAMSLADGGATAAATASTAALKRIGKPEELASTVNFLVSEGAGYITGAIIDFNGGSYLP